MAEDKQEPKRPSKVGGTRAEREEAMSPSEHIREAEAKIQAGAGPEGLAPVQVQVLRKLRSADVLLGHYNRNTQHRG